MPGSGFGTVAAGNITQRRFLKQSAVGTVVMATDGTGSAGDQIYGISGEGTRCAPYGGLDDGYLAVSGENVKVHFPGEICQLTCGAAVAVGERLKSDATGRGIPVTAAGGQQYGAIALAVGATNGYIPVRIEIGVTGVIDTT